MSIGFVQLQLIDAGAGTAWNGKKDIDCFIIVLWVFNLTSERECDCK